MTKEELLSMFPASDGWKVTEGKGRERNGYRLTLFTFKRIQNGIVRCIAHSREDRNNPGQYFEPDYTPCFAPGIFV